ncbi:MAG: DUF4282 domain-containing protein [Anaerolineales bacterium]
MDTQKPMGFFQALFDTSFSELITPKIIRVLYMIGIVIAGIVALAFIISGFGRGIGLGILSLILSPILFVLYVIMFRVGLETLIVVFQIAENTRR